MCRYWRGPNKVQTPAEVKMFYEKFIFYDFFYDELFDVPAGNPVCLEN